MTMAILCLFTRAPVLGAVKRRLAAEIGDAAALDAHCRLLQHALEQLSGVPGVRTDVWVAGPPAALAPWLPAGFDRVHRQRGGDLGERMGLALRLSLDQAPRAVLVGSDCPAVDAGYVGRALAALDTSDLVLGPAEDGGYGLIGVSPTARSRLSELFRDIPWGTGEVLTTTLQRATAASLSPALLPPIWDVDTAADWQRFLARG